MKGIKVKKKLRIDWTPMSGKLAALFTVLAILTDLLLETHIVTPIIYITLLIVYCLISLTYRYHPTLYRIAIINHTGLNELPLGTLGIQSYELTGSDSLNTIKFLVVDPISFTTTGQLYTVKISQIQKVS